MELTKEIAIKVKETVECGLSSGIGNRIPGEMCVEAAVCYAYDLPHGDNPPCVGSAVRSFKIKLNDSNWSSNKARGKGMLKISISQLNSNVIDQREFSRRIIIKIVNHIISSLAAKYAPELEEKLKIVTEISEIVTLCRELQQKVAAYAAAAYAKSFKKDEILTKTADLCLEVLIEMKSPGCKYLYLLEK